jgi:TatD family-associated radical SAM protein
MRHKMPSHSSIVYFSGAAASRQMYVALTNRCNARTLPETRGPGFSMRTFSPLYPPDFEPSEDEVVVAVERALEAEAALPPLCFAGLGEPLLRESVLLGATKRLRRAHAELSVRVSTNGLFEHPQPLVARLAEAGISSVSVALAAADACSYFERMRPVSLGSAPSATIDNAFETVCEFVRAAAETGLQVECTAVAAPGVNIEQTRALAQSLGASEWRVREYFPA